MILSVAFALAMAVTSQTQYMLVWANYQNGNWDIYLQDTNGQSKKLTNTSKDEMHPRFSKDGKWIYYFYGTGDDNAIRRMNLSGEVDSGWGIDSAEYFSLIGDDKMIYQSNAGNRSTIKWINLSTSKTWDDDINSQISGTSIYEPDATPDGKTVFALIASSGWHVVRSPGVNGKYSKLQEGCQPVVSPDGKTALYVHADGNGDRSIRAHTIGTGSEYTFIDMSGGESHEYNPKFSNDGKYVVFSACPNGQHTPTKSSYKLYLKKWGSSDAPTKIIDMSGSNYDPDIYFTSGDSSTTTSLATLSSHSNNATIRGGSTTFKWNDTGAEAYALWLGSQSGGYDFYGKVLGTSTSVSVSGLPTDGSVIYARLHSKVNGSWGDNYGNYKEYKLKTAAASSAASLAEITSPADGSTIKGGSATFKWEDSGAEAYALWIGSASGKYDYYGKEVGKSTSVKVSNLPKDGSKLYVRLYSKLNGGWGVGYSYYVPYTYKTSK